MAVSNISPLKGMPELKAKLKELKKVGGRAVLRRAVRAGAIVIREEAKSRLGQLGRRSKTQRGVIVEERKAPPGVAIAVVGIAKKKWFLRFLERGAKPHPIKVSSRKKILVTKEGVFLGKMVQHPGVRATPFLQPAYQARKDDALAAMRKAFKEAVDKAASGATVSAN